MRLGLMVFRFALCSTMAFARHDLSVGILVKILYGRLGT